MPLKIGMVSLGCPKNQVDAEILLSLIKKEGWEITTEAGLSDVVVVNTCGFIESAKQESIDTILEFCELKKEGRISKIVITGCLAERYRDEIKKEIPEVDVILGIGSNENIVDVIKKSLGGEELSLYGEKCDLPLSGDRVLSTLPFYAYLKVAEGCDNRCSYCAIPLIRGGFRSRPQDDIIKEATLLAENGVEELVLVAQDTTRYGEDLYGKYMLADLLKQLVKIEKLRWIRILYCYPDRITDELIKVIAEEPKICKYLDIPIQHVAENVVSRMNRTGNRKTITELLTKIRKNIPDIVLRTTLIAGFPGETEDDFTELCEFIDEMKFERLGCFPYSAEDDTPAATMPNQIDEDTKNHRAEHIMEQQMFIMDNFNKTLIGKQLEVVVEGFDQHGQIYFGRSKLDAPDIDGKVFFTSKTKRYIGDFINVKIEEIMDYDLLAKEV